MRTRHPFADIDLTYEDSPAGAEESGMFSLVEHEMQHHPDAVEKGIDLPLGFMPHAGENRVTRRAAVANWAPPVSPKVDGADMDRKTPAMPTRRELLKQRQKQRRGKLDPETRRLQRKAINGTR